VVREKTALEHISAFSPESDELLVSHWISRRLKYNCDANRALTIKEKLARAE
jgi:hypothetical protein